MFVLAEDLLPGLADLYPLHPKAYIESADVHAKNGDLMFTQELGCYRANTSGYIDLTVPLS